MSCRCATSRFLELSYLLSNEDRDGDPLDVSFASMIELCRQLSFSFLRLHARGLCYRDISFGNVFFDPENGDVLICDNDNVGIDNGTGRVLGTPLFMAPEVVSDTTFQHPAQHRHRPSLAGRAALLLTVRRPPARGRAHRSRAA